MTRVSVTVVRGLYPVALSPSSRINVLYGDNGNGKTSVFEAIHLLGPARSFRSVCLQPVIQYEEAVYTVFGQVMLTSGVASNLGISREHQGEFTIRINGQDTRSAAQLAETLSLRLINPNSFRLFGGAPKIHRQFLDWGMLHVGPRLLPVWRHLQKTLRRRNSWLRHGRLNPTSQATWDQELSLVSDEIDTRRRSCIQVLKLVFEETLAGSVSLDDLTLSYYRGQDKDRDLLGTLASSLLRNQQMGHTQAGPQRMDLHTRLAGHNAAEILLHG